MTQELMRTAADTDRRGFLKVAALAAGGFAIGLHLPGRPDAHADEAPFVPNAWIRIDSRAITILMSQAEMGQGVITSLPTLVAEELEVALDQVRVEHAPADHVYGNPLAFGEQLTGGSTSVHLAWEPPRRAGATAREMLIAAAAQTWGVNKASCRAENGTVVHGPSGRRAPYTELAARAASMPVPENIRLKEPADFRLIGRSLPRIDTPAKVDGSALYANDIRRPGMLIAMLRRCPVAGGTVAAYDPHPALSIPGVRDVVEVDRGIAVLATDTWAAMRGVDALRVEWDEGPNAELSSAQLAGYYVEALEAEPTHVPKSAGDVEAALAGAARTVEATYEVPFLAHASMETMVCTADVRTDGCDLWVPTQAQTLTQRVAAEIAGLDPAAVRVHNQLIGGSFGRRSEVDFVIEAVQLSAAVGAPVQVVWSREDDIRHGVFRAHVVSRLTAGLNKAGEVIAWSHRLVGPSAMRRFAPFVLQDGFIDFTSGDGAVNRAYAIPNRLVDSVEVKTPLPAGFWRSVGNSHTAFAMEAFLDELAIAAGRDPYAYRRHLLKDAPRHRAVLDLAAAQAGWGTPLPPGRHRGIAFHESMGSIVAQVAEISALPGEEARVHRVVCAIDCGRTVNPDTVIAQVEGSIVFGLTAALWG